MTKQEEEEAKRRTTVFIPKEIFRDIKIISAYRECRVNDCIVEALEKFVKENINKTKKLK